MSAVISSIAHYLGLAILLFIGSTEEEDKRLGFVAPVLFFILALQTGLSSLDPDQRLVRLSRNMCLLLTAILHFVHGMTDTVLMSLSAAHAAPPRRHLPVLLVVVSLTVYVLFMLDGFYNVLWEKLDDYVYYVRSTGSVMEFLFGVVMFANGAYTMMFESGSKIRACMMFLHAYFNIYLQARNGWKTFVNRRSAVQKINSLPEARGGALRLVDDVCAICYQEFSGSARVTPCRHYFHAACLRKWLYIQDSCPMCHQRVYVEDDDEEARARRAFTDNNAAREGEEEGPPGQPRPQPPQALPPAGGGANGQQQEEEEEEVGDNDSIEYDEEEWGGRSSGTALEEEEEEEEEQYLDDEESESEEEEEEEDEED
ncbi:hypothetical protein CRUP_037623 [Coryphaenoides rupestris]|nr:hypothetical protein CRUP_037623 [Coryphaenoides rupestris]